MVKDGTTPIVGVVGAGTRNIGVRDSSFQENAVQLCVALMEEILCSAVEDVGGLRSKEFRV